MQVSVSGVYNPAVEDMVDGKELEYHHLIKKKVRLIGQIADSLYFITLFKYIRRKIKIKKY